MTHPLDYYSDLFTRPQCIFPETVVFPVRNLETIVLLKRVSHFPAFRILSRHGGEGNLFRFPLHTSTCQDPRCRNGLHRYCTNTKLSSATSCALPPWQPNFFIPVAEHNSLRLESSTLRCSGPHRHGCIRKASPFDVPIHRTCSLSR